MNQTEPNWVELKSSLYAFMMDKFPTYDQYFEDIIQDIFLLALTNEEPIKNMEAFCIGCAKVKLKEMGRPVSKSRNFTRLVSLDEPVSYHEDEYRRIETSFGDILVDSKPSPIDLILLKDKYKFALRFLRKQKPYFQNILKDSIFVLKDLRGDVHNKYVAEKYNTTYRAVDTIVFRFRKKLREKYEFVPKCRSQISGRRVA